MDSRRAFAAACRRVLTSANSRAARSIRSCCVSARSSASSDRWRTVSNCFDNSATWFVSVASWPAMSADSDSEAISPSKADSTAGQEGVGAQRPNSSKDPDLPQRLKVVLRGFGDGRFFH